MGNERGSDAVAKLRSALANTREKIVSDGLFVGTSCAIALVSYTHYTPVLAHTSPEALSFSDVACLFGALTSLVLLAFSRHDRPVFAQPTVIWISSACVLVSILAFALFPALAYMSPLLVSLVGGGLFGVYLSVMAVCWLWVYAHHSAAVVIWNIAFSALVGAIMLWFIVGMDTPRVACSLAALLCIGAYSLTKRMRLLQGSLLDQSSLDSDRHTPAHIIVATFLFSYAFMVSLSFAGLEHFSLAFSAIVILIPFLLVSVLMISFKRLTVLSLLNVAVPIIVTATLSASFLDLNPVITFDLALIGILLFLAYAVVFLCAITEKTDSHAYRAFSLLMLSYFGGCIVGRAVSAWAMFGTMRARHCRADIGPRCAHGHALMRSQRIHAEAADRLVRSWSYEREKRIDRRASRASGAGFRSVQSRKTRARSTWTFAAAENRQRDRYRDDHCQRHGKIPYPTRV